MSVLRCTYRIVFLHGAIGFNAMLEAIKLPAVVTSLDTSLAQVDGDAFYFHKRKKE
jgi:hypothetical protein